jgi:hypothetical protein
MQVALLGDIMYWPGEAVEGFVSWLSVMRIGIGRLSKTPKSDHRR